MPKQPGGISKSERMQAIIDLLNRAGLLDKQEINQRLASHFNVDPEALDRAIYRDLNELVDANRIFVCSKDSLGYLINPELDEAKNFKNYWYTEAHSPHEISGIGYLKDHGCNLILHSSLQEYVKCIIDDMYLRIPARLVIPGRNFYLGIYIDKAILPIKIFISRSEELTPEFKEDFFKTHGKRSVILQLPDNSFSRFQEVSKAMLSIDLSSEKCVINNPQNRKIRIEEISSGNNHDLILHSKETHSIGVGLDLSTNG